MAGSVLGTLAQVMPKGVMVEFVLEEVVVMEDCELEVAVELEEEEEVVDEPEGEEVEK